MGHSRAHAASTIVSEIPTASFNNALALWSGRDATEWSSSPEFFRVMAERLLALGEPIIAYDVTSEGLNVFANDQRLRQLQGLSLARTGATETANQLLRTLYLERHDSEESLQETMGILARTHKDLGLRDSDPYRRADNLKEARDLYLSAFATTSGYWTGVNAATLSLLIVDLENSRRLARQIRELCVGLLNAKPCDGDRFWLSATLGEAALLLDNVSEAELWYRQTRDLGPNRYADLNTARRNAVLILNANLRDSSWLLELLKLPSVAVCVGHMIDIPGSMKPRFPAELEGKVREELRRLISELNVGFGYASAACGTDILFLECLLEAGKEAFIVLPYSADEFRQSSVDVVPQGKWGERFERVLASATQVVFASTEGVPNKPTSIRYANTYLRGLAQLRANQLQTNVFGLAVWDHTSAVKPGGTSDTLMEWRSIGFPFKIVDLTRLRESSVSPPEQQVSQVSHVLHSAEFETSIHGLLFADAVGFSKLRESQIPTFVRTFLGRTAELLKSTSHGPVFKNTWGDGMYFVFDSVSDAGAFAMELRDMIRNMPVTANDLPPGMSLRIGLHAGPVYSCYDPIIERTNYVGSHVSRAARIEPIAPPGEVYASEAFAALSAAEGAQAFFCEYVGRTPQAKNYGTFPTYVLRPQLAD